MTLWILDVVCNLEVGLSLKHCIDDHVLDRFGCVPRIQGPVRTTDVTCKTYWFCDYKSVCEGKTGLWNSS